MSAFCWLGHNHTAPASTATPMAISAPTTTLAAMGPNGAGPLSECEWAWECVTRNRVEVESGRRSSAPNVGHPHACRGEPRRLLAVGRQEVAKPLDRVGKVTGPRQRHDPQVIGCRPVEAGALGDQDLLLQQQIEDELLVVLDVVNLGVKPRERVKRPLRLHARHPGDLIEL